MSKLVLHQANQGRRNMCSIIFDNYSSLKTLLENVPVPEFIKNLCFPTVKRFQLFFCCCFFVLFDSLCPINNLSVIKGLVFLG